MREGAPPPPAPARGIWGSAVSSPIGVWGEAPEAFEFRFTKLSHINSKHFLGRLVRGGVRPFRPPPGSASVLSTYLGSAKDTVGPPEEMQSLLSLVTCYSVRSAM